MGSNPTLSANEMPDLPRLYREFAPWFHLLTHPSDYAEEAALWRAVLDEWANKPRTVLELGSGGGNNASHMKAWYTLTLTDLSEDMLAISRELNPELEHLQGDMRTLRLGRTFDAVFVHDAIAYITTGEDLRKAMATAFVHCKPGGAALFVPDDVRETYKPGLDDGGHDGPDGRALRYLEWSWDPDPSDTTYLADFAYLLRSPDGSVRVEHDRHVCGLFSREEWLGWLREVGFEAQALPLELSDVEPGSQEMFIARRLA